MLQAVEQGKPGLPRCTCVIFVVELVFGIIGCCVAVVQCLFASLVRLVRDQCTTKSYVIPCPDAVPQPFHSQELHRRTEGSSMTTSWAVVEYPATFNASATAGPDGASGGGAGAAVVKTSEAWEAVTTPSTCRAVEAVRIALVGTNRHLVRGASVVPFPSGRTNQQPTSDKREGFSAPVLAPTCSA